ncbi:MAG: hypothetical protein QOJ19_3912 [Acidimicrobiia bacterium]|jgi:membrane-bound lytic murein transglycosylase B|nr:hypothetical protein [Acidimicrobiia bacterium]
MLTLLSLGVVGLPTLAGAADADVSTLTTAAPTTVPTGPTSPSAGSPAGGNQTSSSTVLVDASDGVAPALANLPLTTPDAATPERVISQLLQDQRDAAAAQAGAEADLVKLGDAAVALDRRRQSDLDAVAAARQRAQDSRDEAAGFGAQAEQVRLLLEDLAMAAYVGLGNDGTGLNSGTITDSTRRSSYGRNVFDLKAAERRGYQAQQATALAQAAEADREVGRLEGRVDEVDGAMSEQRAAVADAEHRRQEAIDRQTEIAARLEEADQQITGARRTAKVIGLDFPLVVLDALWKASSVANTQYPACRVSWSLLAGISRIESGHGTSGGAIVAPNGDVTPRILGPVLDGKSFALILDTDKGAWDGDPVFDRAVGPMQFIPSSWAIFGQDGNGDGRADPNNYYDAALGAANHLCRGGADTSIVTGRRAAVLSYNQSEEYLAAVSALADSYANFVIPPLAPTPPAPAANPTPAPVSPKA